MEQTTTEIDHRARQTLIQEIVAEFSRSLAGRSDEELRNLLEGLQKPDRLHSSVVTGPHNAGLVHINPEHPRELIAADLETIASWLRRLAEQTGPPS